MKTGKLPAEALRRLLSTSRADPDVIIGPAYGEDAAAVRISKRVLIAASDPVTFTTDRIGHYAVSVNANDLAVTGCEPRFFLATILIPPDADELTAARVFEEVQVSCESLGVALVGGHTEFTDSVSRVVVSGCMLGELDEDELVRTSGARVGDSIILAGRIAVEGAAILAREAGEELILRGVRPELIARAMGFLDDPGISVLAYARTARNAARLTAMHDPTEGGLATAIAELAAASGVGVVVRRDSIPLLDECRVFCEALGLNPLGLIASGSLLITCSEKDSLAVIGALHRECLPATEIGRITASGRLLFDDGEPLPSFERDEIARYFEGRA